MDRQGFSMYDVLGVHTPDGRQQEAAKYRSTRTMRHRAATAEAVADILEHDARADPLVPLGPKRGPLGFDRTIARSARRTASAVADVAAAAAAGQGGLLDRPFGGRVRYHKIDLAAERAKLEAFLAKAATGRIEITDPLKHIKVPSIPKAPVADAPEVVKAEYLRQLQYIEELRAAKAESAARARAAKKETALEEAVSKGPAALAALELELQKPELIGKLAPKEEKALAERLRELEPIAARQAADAAERARAIELQALLEAERAARADDIQGMENERVVNLLLQQLGARRADLVDLKRRIGNLKRGTPRLNALRLLDQAHQVQDEIVATKQEIVDRGAPAPADAVVEMQEIHLPARIRHYEADAAPPPADVPEGEGAGLRRRRAAKKSAAKKTGGSFLPPGADSTAAWTGPHGIVTGMARLQQLRRALDKQARGGPVRGGASTGFFSNRRLNNDNYHPQISEFDVVKPFITALVKAAK